MTEPTPTKRSVGMLTVEVGPSVKSQWVQWCQERNLVSGKAVRRLVEHAMAEGLELGSSAKGVSVKVRVMTAPDTGTQIGREIYFRPGESAAIKAVAQAQGFGFHEWVIAAVRGALANAPTYGQAEIEAVTQSNLVLLQVVAELGAIRKRMAVVDQSADADQTQKLQELERTLSKSAVQWHREQDGGHSRPKTR